MTDADTARIRELNDAFRRDPSLFGLQVGLDKHVVTQGVAARGDDFVDRALRAVRQFSDFGEHNDPHGEHDFGRFTLDGVPLFWKIDYFDIAMTFGSPDPANPDVTRRVLTIMLAQEY